jgi:hypothetical protein
MNTVGDTMDQLRGRTLRARTASGLGGWRNVAGHVGVTEGTLRSFLAGKDVNLRTVQLIEAWCERVEHDQGHVDI